MTKPSEKNQCLRLMNRELDMEALKLGMLNTNIKIQIYKNKYRNTCRSFSGTIEQSLKLQKFTKPLLKNLL